MPAGERIDARLLFVSASAEEESPLAVDLEYNRVKGALESIGQWPQWRTVTEHLPAAEWEQLPGQMLAHEPSIVHFAGHGHADGSLRLRGPDGEGQQVQAAAVEALFASFRHHVRIVLLNACYSDALAASLVDHIDVVIGMSYAVPDDSAVRFAPAFYQQLAGGRSVQAAFDVACAVVLGLAPTTPARDFGSALNEADPVSVPQMRVRTGVDASQLVVAPRPEPAGGMRLAPLAGGVVAAGALALGAWHLWPSATGAPAVPRAAPLELQRVGGEGGVAPFHLARTELTQAAWRTVTGANPSDPAYDVGDAYPVNNITGNEAIEVANELSRREGKPPCYEPHLGGWRATAPPCRGYRLLTVAERDALDRLPPHEPACTIANVADQTLAARDPELLARLESVAPDLQLFGCRDGFARLAPVGSLSADHHGLMDLHGNVSEWVWNEATSSPSVRGSSFLSAADKAMASADGLPAHHRSYLIGVRYARDDAR